MWTNWPQREIDGLTKAYVLAQLAYWTQQLLVVHLEARRPDYWQMLAHHFATIALIYSAHAYHHTRVSNLIFVLMDIIELIFPVRPSRPVLSPTGYDANDRKACEMPKVSGLHNHLRRSLRHIHGYVARDAPHILPHGMLERLSRLAPAHADTMLQRARGQSAGSVSRPRERVISLGAISPIYWHHLHD